MDGTLKIDVVADVVCPWCYLGWMRLQQALKMRPDVKAEITWRPFQLNPGMPEEGVDYKEYMAKKFDPERMKESRARLSSLGAEAGIAFNFDKIERSANTNAAHRLIYWAQQEGRLEAIVPAVMRALFTEGRFIGDAGTLADIGASIGMDRAALAKKFADGTDRDTIAALAQKAQAEGVNSVPAYIIGGRVKVEGSWPAEDLARKIDAAIAPARKTG